jgi:hypothetical protein
MGKKRVPISLRKPPSPDAAPTLDESKPEAATPAAPEPEIAARVAEPEVPAPAVEPEVVAPPALPAVEAIHPLVPQAPPAIIVGADGRTMRAVTVYLPAELVDKLVDYCRDQGLDLVREAIEASLGNRIGASARAAAGAPSAHAARPVPPWSTRFGKHGMARRLVARVERWLERGWAIMAILRTEAEPS